ncbi:MAG: hypothetical protein ACKVZH_04880 [Blastocatellia bacterium]
MNTKFTTRFTNAIFAFVCLLGLGIVANAQAQYTPKPVIYSTKSKLVIAKLKNGDADVYDVRGNVTFTFTAANSDDTIAGTLTYSVPDDARQKIASMSGKALNTVPASITRKDTIVSFQKATEPPVLHLEIGATDIDVAGVKMRFSRIVLDVNARDQSPPDYSVQEMEALITVWARQINGGRSRRGIIARVNKVINGEPE